MQRIAHPKSNRTLALSQAEPADRGAPLGHTVARASPPVTGRHRPDSQHDEHRERQPLPAREPVRGDVRHQQPAFAPE
eukprot:1574672-Prymnesium_polylepis.1